MKELTKDFFFRFLLHPGMRFYRHLLLFLVILILVINMGYISKDANVWGERRVWMSIPSMLIFFFLFYANLYLGVPRYLLRNRWGRYLLFLVGLSIVLLLITLVSQAFLLPDFFDRVSEVGIIRIGLSLLASGLNVSLFSTGISALFLLRNWIISDQQIGELQSATLQSELNLLKNQINPHFLFNMLNNTNVLLKKDPEKARTLLFRLEELLRYQLHDSVKEWVSLESELSFLQDFLQLEQVRRDRFSFQIRCEGEIAHKIVPPLLFIPFVENAAKYSQDSEEDSYVDILFRVENERLFFYCRNSKAAREYQRGKAGGLGLPNIRRRLELLYPGDHILEIKEEKRMYEVRMEISLNINRSKER